MVLMNFCCCWFSLRSGMLLLGWSQALLSVLALSGVIIADNSESSSSINQLLGKSLRTLYVLLGGSVIQTIAAVFLLYGVYRRKSYYVFEYVKLETLLHIASLIEFLLYLILEHSTFSSQDVYIFVGFLALNYGLAGYYLLAAYSYYKLITEDIYAPLIQS
uniref:MARVEL domain-containing protein n=1 Tax=Graphocephala atropunctata TaxID=36148 RepID=A0A1B6L9Y8_9HEMI